MTETQRKRFYFPKWVRIAAALDRRMEGGRLLADLDAQFEAAGQFSVIARDLVRAIISRARALSAREHRAVTADDLRHALNLCASGGKHESSSRMTNSQLNEFDRICAILAAPFVDNLGAVIPYLNSTEDDRQRAVAYLRTLSYDAQLRAISENLFQTREWDTELDVEQLGRLVLVVKGSGRQRMENGRSKVAKPAWQV